MPSITVAPEALEAALSDTAKGKLEALQRKYEGRNQNAGLDNHIRAASQLLSDIIHPISVAKVERRRKFENLVAREKDRGDPMDPEEHAQREGDVKEFEGRVEDVTKKMDTAIRQIIDDRVWLEQLGLNLKHITSRNNTNNARSTQATQRTTQRSIVPTQDATPRDDDEEDEDEPEEDQAPPPYEETPTALLSAALLTHTTTREAKSLTDRYAHDNDYAGWYKSRHVGLTEHQTMPPPVPAPALWFGAEEGNALTANGADDTMEVVGERVSVKCPMTMQYFIDPVTSDICRHSYEKSAILDYLKMSEDRVPYTPEQQAQLDGLRGAPRANLERKFRVPRVKCPVAGCDQLMLEKDLRPDPFIRSQAVRAQAKEEEQKQKDAEREARRAKKAKAAKKRNRNGNEEDDISNVEDSDPNDSQEDDSEDDDDVIAGTQRRPVGLGSSPVPDRRASTARNVKREEMLRSSAAGGSGRGRVNVQIPSSQRSRRQEPWSEEDEDEAEEDDEDEEGDTEMSG
jgi:E3 SUMO-protein ligase NSE2